MEIKLFEIRDRGTCIAAMAVRIGYEADPREAAILGHAGFGQAKQEGMPYVLLADLSDGKIRMGYDSLSWKDRTMKTAHIFIANEWNKLPSGAVVDVEYIKGETAKPKRTDL